MASRRLGLLPPYLASNPVWQQLVEAIDEVLVPEIDDPTKLLARIRDNWILNDSQIDLVDAREILASEDAFYQQDRETLIRQANMLGFLFKEADLMSDEDYQRVVRNLSSYWYVKGTPKFIDFLAFILNTTLDVIKLWSTPGSTYDTYGPLKQEGDPAIGTPNHEGGTWFETSHVDLAVDPTKFGTSQASMDKLVALFNTLANYDLVLNSIAFQITLDIHSPGDEEAVITMAYPMIDIEMLIYASDEFE
jgi:hypothetical protein